MTNKRKTKGKKSYVELRNKQRRKEKGIIRRQLAPKEIKKIIELSGLSPSTVYKALNKNLDYWSPRTMEVTIQYIDDRDKTECDGKQGCVTAHKRV